MTKRQGHTPGPWWTAARYDGRECAIGVVLLTRAFLGALDELARQQQQFAVEERQFLPARLDDLGR